MKVEHSENTANDSSAYAEYAGMLLRLHRLIRDDRDETTEADELCDHMDEAWERMSEQEILRVRGLGADLNSLLPDSPFQHPTSGGIQCREVSQQIKSARQTADYQGILRVLRERPECVSADRAAFLRGWCYERLGDPEVAALFFEHAARLDQNNDLYAVFVPDQSSANAMDAGALS